MGEKPKWEEALDSIQEQKEMILHSVYYDANEKMRSLEDVYANQKDLSNMAMNIYTEVGGALINALREDGIDTMAWASVSTRINQLVFVSVPTAAVLREQYRDAFEAGVSGKYSATVEDEPKLGACVKMRKCDHIPQSVYWMAGLGLAVPLLVYWGGQRYVVLAKLFPAIRFAGIVLEIVAVCILCKAFAKKGKQRKTLGAGKSAASTQQDEQTLFNETMEQIRKDNMKALQKWFKELKESLHKEIARRAGI